MINFIKAYTLFIALIITYFIIAQIVMRCENYEVVSKKTASMSFNTNTFDLKNIPNRIYDLRNKINAKDKIIIKYHAKNYTVLTSGNGLFDLGGVRFFTLPSYTYIYIFDETENMIKKIKLCSRVVNVRVEGEFVYFSWEDWFGLRTGYGRVKF